MNRVWFIAAIAVLAATPSARAGTTDCVGAVDGGTYQSIEIPAGASCTLTDVTVKGHVRGRKGSSLELYSSRVGGSVLLDRPAYANIGIELLGEPGSGNAIGGNLEIARASGNVNVGDNQVAGNVDIHDGNGEAFLVVGESAPNTIGKNLRIANQTLAVARITSNRVGRSLLATGNTITDNSYSGNVVSRDLKIVGNSVNSYTAANTVGGHLIYDRNTGLNVLRMNAVTKLLLCRRNSPPPLDDGFVNSAAGQKGQCADL